jgi:hypothetical protein
MKSVKNRRFNNLRHLSLALALVGLLGWAGLPASFWRHFQPTAEAATFTVTNTNAVGAGSLRQAILDANANGSAVTDTITFNIPGGGLKSIKPTAAFPLPAIQTPVIIDGYTQPGSQPNTNTTGGLNAVLMIEIDGTNAGNLVSLLFSAGSAGSSLRGVVINRFAANGVDIDANNVAVKGCFIGTDSTGTLDLGNKLWGIEVDGTGVIIGGTNAADRNLISGNDQVGIQIGDNAPGTTVKGNLIGTDKSGNLALGNGTRGMLISGSGNIIGGTTAVERNVISGNGGDGIAFGTVSATGNFVRGNYIGTIAGGTSALGNDGCGILLLAGDSNTIGGTSAGGRNVISGNKEHGIQLGQQANNNLIVGNFIGPDAGGAADYGNKFSGIMISSGTGNVIGGDTPAERNVISGNDQSGIRFNNSDNNTVQGNFIGTKADGATPLGNGHDGVLLEADSDNNKIGGTAANTGNTIAHNKIVAIYVDNTGEGNSLLGNSIFSQDKLGINLSTPNDQVGGVSPNDPGDGDGSANKGQNFPILTAASHSGGILQISGTLNSAAGSAFRVEYFSNFDCDPSGHGEGKTLLGTKNVTTDAGGNADVSIALATFSPGQFVTATATDSNNNTSEFSQCRQVNEPHGALQFSAAAYNFNEGGEVTVTVTRTGGTGGAISVQYATSNGTAKEGEDYAASSSTLSFADGEGGSKTFKVAITHDLLYEGSADETINLTLSNPTNGAQLGAQATAVINIKDNDQPPVLTIDSVTVTEGQSGVLDATFTINLSKASGLPVTFDCVSNDLSATEGSDYQPINQSMTYNVGESGAKTVTVIINGDTVEEPDETFKLKLFNLTNATLGSPGAAVGTILNDDAPRQTSELGFTQSGYTVMEGAQFVTLTVNRTGDTSSAAKVFYSTSDASGLTPCTVAQGKASERCDYATSVSTLRWAAGEGGQKSFSIPIIDDVHVEGQETFTVTLSNPSGGNLGAQQTTTVTITDNSNDAAGAQNPVDTVDFYVSMQYIDFLNRLPDGGGFTNWTGTLSPCPGGGYGIDNPSCDRIHVSKSFYQSEEFQGRGYWAYRFYQASLGRSPLYAEFIPDMARVGGPKSPQEEALAKEEFTEEWMQRAGFKAIYDALSDPAYVDKLLQTAGVTLANKSQMVEALANGQKTRAQILREVVESKAVEDRFYVEGFVSMQYFGYLRRDPDAVGYSNYVLKLNQTGDPRQMVFDFIYSTEYRERFGPQ